MFSLNSIYCKLLCRVEWDLKIVSNLIQRINEYGFYNKHDLTEQIHSMVHAIMSKSEYYWEMNNNYIEKLITKKLNQIANYFPNILGIMTCY